MEATVAADVAGVIGECGGRLSCATCQVYVDEGWRAVTGNVGASEDALLDVTDAERSDDSRLSVRSKWRRGLMEASCVCRRDDHKMFCQTFIGLTKGS